MDSFNKGVDFGIEFMRFLLDLTAGVVGFLLPVLAVFLVATILFATSALLSEYFRRNND